VSTEAEAEATEAAESLDHEIEAEVDAHAGLPLAHGEHAHPSNWFYVKIAAVLATLTGMEVTVTYIDIGKAFMPVLLTLMTIKFVMVVLFFMHLKYDHAIFGKLFWSGLILAVSVYCTALATFHVFASSP